MWWLDGWFDLDAAQEASLRPVIDRWFAWHRATELPAYAEQLAQWRARVETPVTGTEICAWTDQVNDRLWRSVEAALPAATAQLPSVTEAQWQYLRRRQDERLAEAREKFLPPRPEERLAAALDRAVERAEDAYGPLLPAQRELLARRVAASPFDPTRWLAERESRQHALAQALREAQALPAAQRAAAVRAAAERFWRGGGGPYREMEARWRTHNCETVAQLHRTATPEQRSHLRERLAGWEEDVRALAAAGAS
jgi:hypothetical protein